jgi:hypothetical protein
MTDVPFSRILTEMKSMTRLTTYDPVPGRTPYALNR